jgi:DNA polymerase-3 subunit epsilon
MNPSIAAPARVLVLAYDTETTGLPLFKDPSEDPRQPHLVELCGLLYDEERRELVDSYHAIIRPDGWTIPDDVAKIHGITTERALAEGVPEAEALAAFLALHRRSTLRVAHNESFDARILRIAIKRYGHGAFAWEQLTQEQRDAIADEFKAAPAFCTCNKAKPIMQLPATDAMRKSGRGSWHKPPNLQEAHQHFLGRSFDGAHGARADAEACARIYFAMNQPTVAEVA